MARKITIIGAGSVGAAITNDIMVQGLARDIVLVDINKEKAFGEALDVYQGVPFCSPATVRSGDYSAAAGSDIVVITSGMPRKAGQTRLELAQNNVNILCQITPQIVQYAPDAIYIIVSNPVDVLTYVYGEHGDSSFVPWSRATIANNHIDSYRDNSPDKYRITWNKDKDYAEVEEFVKTSGGQVIKSKGATFFAVAIAVCHIIKCIQSGQGTALTVSTMMNGEYGVDDVCLSTLAIVGKEGVRGKILTPLTDEEVAKLQHSADCLKEVIKSVNFG